MLDAKFKEPEAWIIATRHVDGKGKYIGHTFSWNGNPDGLARLRYEKDRSNPTMRDAFWHKPFRGAEIGQDFWLGGLHLLVVDRNYLNDDYLVTLYSGLGYQQMIALRLQDAARLFYWRLILTAAVWGLAVVPAETTPSWRHLNVFKRRQ